MASPLVGSGALSLDGDLGLEVSPMHGLAEDIAKTLGQTSSKGAKSRRRRSVDVSELMKEVEADLGNPLRMSFGGTVYEECQTSSPGANDSQVTFKKLDEKVITPYRAVLDAAKEKQPPKAFQNLLNMVLSSNTITPGGGTADLMAPTPTTSRKNPTGRTPAANRTPGQTRKKKGMQLQGVSPGEWKLLMGASLPESEQAEEKEKEKKVERRGDMLGESEATMLTPTKSNHEPDLASRAKKTASPASGAREAQRLSMHRLSQPRNSPSIAQAAKDRRASWAKEGSPGRLVPERSPSKLAKNIYMDIKSPSALALNGSSSSPYQPRASVSERMKRSPYKAQVVGRQSLTGSACTCSPPGVARVSSSTSPGEEGETRPRKTKKAVVFAEKVSKASPVLQPSPYRVGIPGGVTTPEGQSSPRAKLIQSASKQLDSVWDLINSSPMRRTPEKFTPGKKARTEVLNKRKATPGVKLSHGGGTKYAGHTPYNKAAQADNEKPEAVEVSQLCDDTIPSPLPPQSSPCAGKGGQSVATQGSTECLPRRVMFEEMGGSSESSPTQDYATVALADVMKGQMAHAARLSNGSRDATDSDLSVERSIHAQVAALEADTPTSRYLGSRGDNNSARYSIGSTAARLSVGSRASPDVPRQRLGQSPEYSTAGRSSGESREGTDRKSSYGSSRTSSGSDGYVTAGQGPTPSPQRAEGTRLSLGELLGRQGRTETASAGIEAEKEADGIVQDEEEVGSDNEGTDEEDRSDRAKQDAAVIFMRRRQGPTRGNSRKVHKEEEEDEEDLDVTVALGDLVGRSRASSRLKNKPTSSLDCGSPTSRDSMATRTAANCAHVEDSVSRMHLSVTGMDATLDITVDDKEGADKKSPHPRGVRPIGLEDELTPSGRRSGVFTESPILASKPKAATRSARGSRNTRKSNDKENDSENVKSETPLRRSARKKIPVKQAGAAPPAGAVPEEETPSGTPGRRSRRLVGEAKKMMRQWA